MMKLGTLFNLKQYEEGLAFATANQSLIKTQLNNWVLFKKLEFYHALNADLDRAIEVYEEVISSRFFRLNHNETTRQLWLINEAYLQLLLQYHHHPKADTFNIFKFLNEVDIYIKDKAGYNFSIFVIELMFYLLHQNIDRYMDRMTSLLAYRLRHLNSKEFKRSNLFAQLLLETEKQSFKVEIMEKKGAKKYAYLQSIEGRLNINEWEVVGYDKLWGMALDLLHKL